MNYRFRRRASLAICEDVRHDIMTDFLFAPCRSFIVDVVYMRLHLRYLLIGNIKPQFFFALGESYPEPAPCGKLAVIRKDFLHFSACVSLAERIFVYIVHFFKSSFFVYWRCVCACMAEVASPP